MICVANILQEIASVDNDIKSKFNQYSSTKTSLASIQRARTGNLSQKSLTSIINPKSLLSPDASEYLQQHLIAVPNAQVKDFYKSYESLVEHWVVPRSSQELAKDDEFTLFAVTVFKKYSAEFVHKVRERRWTPREWKFREGGREEEQQEAEKLEKEERRVWGEALRLGRTGYSDAVMAWIHVLALRVFVETVLRYGLPLSFVCGLVKVGTLRGLSIGQMLTGYSRQTTSLHQRQRQSSMPTSRISEAMHLEGIRKAGWPRTTRRPSMRCSQLVTGMRSTTHTSTTSLSSYRTKSNQESTMFIESLYPNGDCSPC